MVIVECIHKDNCERLKGSSKSKMCSINCPDYELRKCDRFSTKTLNLYVTVVQTMLNVN